MRQQRSGYNPFLRDSVHKRDGIIVDHPTRTGEFIQVSGGWADAADYLQYVDDSATATYVMLTACRDRRRAFADAFRRARAARAPTACPTCSTRRATGSSGSRACSPTTRRCSTSSATTATTRSSTSSPTDSSDYGWGKGSERPVYPCTGKPQGLFTAKNRSTGYASTAGKYAAAFALGARLFADARSGVRAHAARKRRRRLRARRASSRRLPDGAGPRAVLLRGRQLGRRHGARRGAAVRADGRAPLPARRARLRRDGAGHAMDGRGHGASLPVVSVAQQRPLRGVARAGDRDRAADWRRYYRDGSRARRRRARTTASASASRSSGARTT